MSGNISDEGNQDDSHKDTCNRCGEGGELLLCDGEDCTNVGCFSCYNLTGVPAGKWFCLECREKVQGEGSDNGSDNGEETDDADAEETDEESDDDENTPPHPFTCIEGLKNILCAQGTKPNLYQREQRLKELLQSCKVDSCTVEQLKAVEQFVKGSHQLEMKLYRKITVRAKFEKKQQEEKLKQGNVSKIWKNGVLLPDCAKFYNPTSNSYRLVEVSTNDPLFKNICAMAAEEGFQVLSKGSFVTPARTARTATTRTATKRKRAQEEKTPMDELKDVLYKIYIGESKKVHVGPTKYRTRKPDFQKVFLYFFSAKLLNKNGAEILQTNQGKQFDINTHIAWSTPFKNEVEKVFQTDKRFTEEVQKNVAKFILKEMKAGREKKNKQTKKIKRARRGKH